MKIRWFSLVAGLAILVLGRWGGDSSAFGQTPLSGHIAYNCAGDICVFNLGTGVNTDVTNSPRVSDSNPKISTAGSKILFDSSGGIYVMNLDGSNRKLLSSVGILPYWSPDGLRIAFFVQSHTSNNGIWIMNADGSGPTQLTTFGYWPAWSPDGTKIAFSYNNEIWLMDVATPSDAQQVVACSRASGGTIDVVWSPGPKILFAGYVNAQYSYDLFTCDPTATGGAGSGLTRLTTSPKQDFEPSWSPDGTMIAWYSARTPAGIWVMNANGTSPQPIIAGGRQPSWGP